MDRQNEVNEEAIHATIWINPKNIMLIEEDISTDSRYRRRLREMQKGAMKGSVSEAEAHSQ